MLHNSGCWCMRENSFTCVTFDSATSRVYTPQMPLPGMYMEHALGGFFPVEGEEHLEHLDPKSRA